jgi:putative membrane protein
MFVSRDVFAQDRPRLDAPQGDPQHNMERNFFRDAASDNTLEIRLCKLAEERATDPQVKQTAQMMEQDHTQANQLIKQLADQNHLDVSTDDLTPVDEACLKQMQDLQGDEFTHKFVFGQVGDHARDELILAFHTKNGPQDVQEYCTQVLPKVQHHLHALEAIARPMAGLSGAEAASDKMAPDAK